MLDAGIAINGRDVDGWTLLMTTAVSGSTLCVALLVERGGDAIDLDATSAVGATALYLAALEGRSQSMSLLLEAGANPSIGTNRGNTPLAVAQARGHHDCAALLEPAMAEPQRPRTLLKARALLDAAYAVRKARADACDKGGLRTRAAVDRRAAAAQAEG